MISSLRVLLLLTFRSLFSHKAKSLIVGGIIAFGTFLLIVGTSLLDSVEASMEESITESVTGQLQVYSADARDALSLFGGMAMGEDIGEIDDFAKVKEVLEAVPNVKSVVPMGINNSTIMGGNDFDRVLGELQVAVDTSDAAGVSDSIEQLRNLAAYMASDYENRLAIAADPTESQEALDTLKTVQDDAFWTDFKLHPAKGMRTLETKIAPLSDDGRLLFLRSLGTDLTAFAKNFDRFEIIEGERVPEGKRGFLLNKRLDDRFMKNIVARGFDSLHKSVVEDGDKIEGDAKLEALVAQNVRQYQRILFEMTPADGRALRTELARLLDEDGELKELLKTFLDVDDDNFLERYTFFYDQIAPKIQLHEINVGDTVTMRTITSSGYFKAINIKCYGRFQFKGLEKSDLSGMFNLIDMISYRDLYGMMTDEQRAELSQLKEDVGVKAVKREDAEAALFGGDGPVESASTPKDKSHRDFDLDSRLKVEVQDVSGDTFTQEEIDHGMARHAAILLEDPERIDETQVALEAAIAKNDLNLKVVDWQEASGIVGQFVIVFRVVLYIAIAIIFLVALVIINNSMVMATVDRIGEIGTMRAIGAKRGFVLAMFLLETFSLGMCTGTLGAGAAVGLMFWLGKVGIPATTDVLVFFFGGPRLYPEVGMINILFGLVVIVLVSLISTLFPAWIATRVQPIEAMQRRD
ncbi:MAG: ABC transporter permease [Deltaproteobacteria bacterium CG_4_9_14_3_um_filter_63_12]|nr:MAG: ABC transporter permease [Deltaproteobacteria bacterium CG_4_9_14_3_um_filter_63_12]